MVCFPKTFLLELLIVYCGPNPMCITTHGLGSSYFARHYSRNRFLFLFLWVLRCFSSPRWPPAWRDIIPTEWWVVPFGNPRIKGHVHLPAAYRSLSRPSSPEWAKASTIRPSLLPFGIKKDFHKSAYFYVCTKKASCAHTFSCIVNLHRHLHKECASCLQSCLFQHVKDRQGMQTIHFVVPSPLVENNGFEPLTPCLQSRCSSQLS